MSERKFNVGDRVRVIGCGQPGSIPLVGKVTVVTAVMWYGYEVDLPRLIDDDFPRAWFLPEHLEPYYDGHEKVSWSECEWRPAGVRA